MHCNICGSLHLRGLLVTPPFRKRNTTHSSALWRRKNDTKLLNPQLLFHHLSFVCFPANADNIRGRKCQTMHRLPRCSFLSLCLVSLTELRKEMIYTHCTLLLFNSATQQTSVSILYWNSTAQLLSLMQRKNVSLTHTHACTHAHTYACMHTHTHTHTHTQFHPFWRDIK